MHTLFILNPTAGKQDCTRQLPQQMLPGTVGRGSLLGKHLPHLRRMTQVIAIACRPLFQLAEQLFRDGAQTFLCQRPKDDHFIQTAHKLWPEPDDHRSVQLYPDPRAL